MAGGSAVERGRTWLLIPMVIGAMALGILTVTLWDDRGAPEIVVQPLAAVYARHTPTRSAADRGTPPVSTVAAQPVDLNSADAATIAALPGIGPALGQEIVADRERRGPFLSIDDLARVDGVSPVMVDAIRDQVAANQ